MKANAVSCIGFGIVLFFLPEVVINFLSTSNQAPKVVTSVLGFALFFNGLHLIWASFKLMPSKLLVLYFSVGDFIWVISTSYLLLTGLWITTSKGIAVTLVVSLMVGFFGLLQMIKRKEVDNSYELA
jgi:hypothetical protein